MVDNNIYYCKLAPASSRLLGNVPSSSPSSSPSYMESVIAGYVAGVCGTLIGHPLDSVKVLLQTNNFGSLSFHKPTKDSVIQSKNPIRMNISTAQSASMSTVKSPPSSRSIRALFAGISGPMMSIGLLQALNFSVYDTTRRMLYQQQQNGNDANEYLYKDPLVNIWVASSWGGVVISLFTNPFNLIKTKQQIMITSFREALQETLQLNGTAKITSTKWSGMKNLLFTGFTPHLFCEGFGRGLYYTSYEFFKRKIIEFRHCQQHHPKDNTISHVNNRTIQQQNLIHPPERALCAAVAGMCQWAVIYPADLVRCRMYAQQYTTNPQLKVSSTSLNIIQNIYKTEGGWKGFYRGFWVTVFRAGPVAAIVLPVYDITLEYLLANKNSL